MFEHLPPEPDRISRRAFIGCAAAAAAGFATYAGTRARHELEIVRIPIAIANLPDAFVGFRIAQLSDIHLVEWTEPHFLQRAVAEINALNPDAVLLTGDFISRGPRSISVAKRAMPVCAEALGKLRAPLRFACLGNHDTAVDDRLVMSTLSAQGIPTLVDKCIPLDLRGDRLWLAGVNDPGTRHPELMHTVAPNPGAPVILMAHEPDYVDRIRRHPRFPVIDLVLSGHTHGGQVRLPGIGPLVLPPMGKKYVDGLFKFQAADHTLQLYVNRGLGTTGVPFRFDCPPEITEITLQRA